MQITSEIQKYCSFFGVNERNSEKWLELNAQVPLKLSGFESKQNARIQIYITPKWAEEIPLAKCLEKWMRIGADWHASSGGLLCFEIDVRWKYLCHQVESQEGSAAVAKFAALWLLRSIAWLTYHHYIADALGLREWPNDWPSWPHGLEGRKLYFKEGKKLSATNLEINHKSKNKNE